MNIYTHDIYRSVLIDVLMLANQRFLRIQEDHVSLVRSLSQDDPAQFVCMFTDPIYICSLMALHEVSERSNNHRRPFV